MYVCICNAITDHQIREARDNGARTIEDLSRELRVASCCGRCSECAQKILCEKPCSMSPSVNTGTLVNAY